MRITSSFMTKGLKMKNDTIYYAFPIKQVNLTSRPQSIELFANAKPVFSEDPESETKILRLCEKRHFEASDEWKKGYVVFKNDKSTLDRQFILYGIEPHLVGQIVTLVIDDEEIKIRNSDSVHFFWLTE